MLPPASIHSLPSGDVTTTTGSRPSTPGGAQEAGEGAPAAPSLPGEAAEGVQKPAAPTTTNGDGRVARAQARKRRRYPAA
jgi:hypothetical protein